MWKAVVNLVGALIAQAQASGEDDPLDRALTMLDVHAHLFRDLPMRASYLEKKGRALLMRAQRTGSRPVMCEAVSTWKKRAKLSPKGRPGHDATMVDLGITLLHSGAMFRRVEDLDEAVAVLDAVKKNSDGSADRALALSVLGNARLERFLRTTRRGQDELTAALADHHEAMDELSPGNLNALTLESDFASALMRAYEQTSDRSCLDASVEGMRRTAGLTPAGHYNRAERLNNLVSALLTQTEGNGDPAALDEAIRNGRDAVAATNPQHILRANCLFGLAYGLFRRGELRGTLLDLDEAAALADEAVQATPRGHTYLPMRLALRAQALLCILPSIPKLEDAAKELDHVAGLMRRDDPDRAVIEANHGAILEALANMHDGRATQLALATEAVRLTRKATDSTSTGHAEYPVRLVNFVVASATLARLNCDATLLDDPIWRCKSVDDRNQARVQTALVTAGLATALATRYELTGDPATASEAIGAYQQASADNRLAAIRRLHAAQAGAVLAAHCGEAALSLSLYAVAIELLDSTAWRGMERRDQERMLSQYAGLPSDAAAMAITAGKPETAVELLEQGRGVLLDRHLDDSADLDRLNQVSPSLMTAFENLRRDLDSIVMPDLEADELDLLPRPPEQESEADQRSTIARQLDSLIAEIRELPGCAYLFRSPAFPILQEQVGHRPIVIVNVSDYRCDALIVSSAGVTVTELPGLTKPQAEKAAAFFRTRAVNAFRRGAAAQLARAEITDRLKWLWDTVAEPVLRDLGITAAAPAEQNERNIYWCPTGPAAFLPLHAAGHHDDDTAQSPLTVIDLAESTYIPKLRALTSGPACQGSGAAGSQQPLIVTMPETPGQRPLASAQEEADHLARLFPGATQLSGPAATREAVLTGMKSHSWFHFSVHGARDERTPVDGGIELVDGRLTIRELMNHRLPGARFAFLSACATHRGSAAVPDEAVTIATAMCVSGCHHVVATQWPVADDHAADFARRAYDQLAGPVDLDGAAALYPEATARALRETARSVRDAYPGQPERWVPFVCTSFR